MSGTETKMTAGKVPGLSGDALKWIAIVTMLIDHVAYASLNPYGPHYALLYNLMRGIGRLAFPLYCFLLVEGFMHTGNYKKYVLRIGLFALISEIPFDLVLCGNVFDLGYQSVMVTLFIGLIGLGAYRWCVNRQYPIYGMMVVIAAVLMGWLTRCDYGAEGVLLVFIFYLFQYQPVARAVALGIWCVMMGGLEIWGVFAIVPIILYNGKRGNTGKWFQYFGYAFYPVHLFLIWLLNQVAGVLANIFLS